MNTGLANMVVMGIITVSIAIGVYLYPQMPEYMASHWNFHGQVDGYIGKTWGLFLLPAILAGMYLLFTLLPRIAPSKSNIDSFRRYYNGFIVVTVGFLFYIYLLTLIWNVGIYINLIRFLSPAFAVLFYYIGMMLPHTKRNWFIGIRTTWTMSSENVWDKTHRQGSAVFKGSAFLALLGMLQPAYALVFILVPLLVGTVYLIIYSYREYKKEKSF